MAEAFGCYSDVEFLLFCPVSEWLACVSMTQRPARSARRNDMFYTGVAVAFVLTVIAGFSRTYYLKTFFGTPHLSLLAHIHGAVFTAWTLFFLFQTALVATGRTELHRRIGIAGTALAALVVLLGITMAIKSVHAGYVTGRPRMDLLLLNSFIDLLLFCLFFAAGLFFRRKREVHKRCMVLAMLSLLIPSIARLPVPVSMIGWLILAFSITGVIYDVAFLRRLSLTNLAGVLLINLATPLRFTISGTQAWRSFAEWLCR